MTLNHPYENGTGTCMYCEEETEFGDFIMTTAFTRDSLEGCGWACAACEKAVHGGHGDEWTHDELQAADRMWQYVGKLGVKCSP